MENVIKTASSSPFVQLLNFEDKTVSWRDWVNSRHENMLIRKEKRKLLVGLVSQNGNKNERLHACQA